MTVTSPYSVFRGSNKGYWAEGGATSGRTAVSNFTFTKFLDSASCKLMEASCAGQHLLLSGDAPSKFEVLNSHIYNTVVKSGELVIMGDWSTPTCTSHEAFLMSKAYVTHLGLARSGQGADDFSGEFRATERLAHPCRY